MPMAEVISKMNVYKSGVMKKLFAFVVLFLAGPLAFGQMEDPVSWAFAARKLDATTYEVTLTATLEEGWHLYSQTTPSGGPVPTSITFSKNPLLTLQGKPKEVGRLEQRHEPLFGVEVKQYSDKVVFVQKVALKGKAKTAVSGAVEYMSCNEEMCLPPTSKKFTLALN